MKSLVSNLTYLVGLLFYHFHKAMGFPSFLKVAALIKATTVEINGTSVVKRSYQTFDLKLIDLLSKSLRFSYELFSSIDGELGRLLPDGNWTGLVAMVKRQQVDMAVSTLALTEQRAAAIACTYPFGYVEMTFATRKPEYNPDIAGFFRPFSYPIWMFLTLCLVMMPWVFFVVNGKKECFQRLAFSVFGSFLHQHFIVKPCKASQYLAATGWLLGMTFLSYIYTALLLSFMTFPPLSAVRTIFELSDEVAKGHYHCMTYPGSFIVDALVNSSDPAVKIIGNDLYRNEGSRDVDGVLRKKMGSKRCAFVGGTDDFLPLKEKYFISNDVFFPTFLTILMRPGFCCRRRLDKVIHYMWSAGLYNKIVDDNAFLSMLDLRSRTESIEKDSERKLSIADFEGAFITFAVGLIISCTTFMLELCSQIVVKFSRKIKKSCKNKIKHASK